MEGPDAVPITASPAGPIPPLNRLFDAPRDNSLSSGLSAPIEHIVILCQENRSLDHYLGFLPGLLSPRPTAGNQLPDAQGKTFDPYHDPTQCDLEPSHHWDQAHQKWNSGRMDGFVAVDDGASSMGYLEADDHLYHADLAQAYGIADNYFCPLIGPTTPNRCFLWTGTHGGWRQNPDPAAPSDVNIMSWPTAADSLEAKSITWPCYAVADGNTPTPVGSFNPYVFFPQHRADPRTFYDISLFLAQARAGTLPNVSWIVTQLVVSEHPPAAPDVGQALVALVTQALQNGPAWAKTALFVTYDESGGFWDHVAPPICEYDRPEDHPWVDTSTMQTQFVNDGQPIGPAFRVPFIAVSPYIREGSVFHDAADHTSVLRFLEWRFGLDPIPTIAPQRRAQLSELVSMFDFSPTADMSTRNLPTTVDISAALKQYAAAAQREFNESVPAWLLPLLGPVLQRSR